MNFGSILKPLSLAFLVIGMSRVAFAMEKQLEELNETLLHAVRENYLEVIQEVLKQGAHVNYADKYGNTALHIASHVNTCLHIGFNEQWNLVCFLLEKGADVNCTDNIGNTALHL